MSNRRFEIPLTDLIDAVSIAQIKETLLEDDRSRKATDELAALSKDIDMILAERDQACSATTIRLVALLGVANLLVWLNKDRMQSEPEKYLALLERAQDLNGIRNHARNILMRRWQEHVPGGERATFLEFSGTKWYSSLLSELEHD